MLDAEFLKQGEVEEDRISSIQICHADVQNTELVKVGYHFDIVCCPVSSLSSHLFIRILPIAPFVPISPFMSEMTDLYLLQVRHRSRHYYHGVVFFHAINNEFSRRNNCHLYSLHRFF